MKTLMDAWQWYESARTNLVRMRRLVQSGPQRTVKGNWAGGNWDIQDCSCFCLKEF